ncbi:MAG: heat-inducible transcriptional repressor HrcA [Oscillospiraceae bacterium]
MDERKLKILAAIVDEYIVTGEPIGSKSIMNLPEINVSAATIRNEMAALEQLGYLEQPHTSAGRIPTFNGFRLYVDRLMSKNALSDDEKSAIDEMLDFEGLSEEAIVDQASHALAELTKCAALVTNHTPKFSVITKVEVIPTGKRLYVLLLITSSGNIKNKVCRLEFDLTNEQLDFFTNYMRENLEGISLETVSDDMMEQLSMAMGTYMMTLSPLVTGLCEISRDLISNELVLKGERNLLTCKEFNQNEIISFLENKNEFTRLLDASFSGLSVMFSDEADKFVINNSSIIASPYLKSGKTAGTLGVIGPMRIDYSKIIPYIEYFTQKITDYLSEDEEDD